MTSRRELIEDGQWDEYRNAVRWRTVGICINIGVFLVLMVSSLALANLFVHGVSKGVLDYIYEFAIYSFTRPWHIFVAMWRWFMMFNTEFPAPWYMWLPILPFVVLFKGIDYVMTKNPYRFINTFGGAGKVASAGDIHKMGLDGKYLLVGKMGSKLLKLNDTRSAICVGTTNEGKTESVVIPAILSADDMCMLIHESGILFDSTSGYRSTVGPVFMLDFTKVDDPEKNIYYPSWNPLASGNLPFYGPGRYNYISSLCYMLIKDGPTGADPYWAKAGRSALEGFVNYICDKCDAAKANDYFLHRLEEGGLDEEDRKVLASYYAAMPESKELVKRAKENLEQNNITSETYLPVGKWDPIPEEWHGHQPSLAMLIDMVTLIQMEINDELKEKRDSGDPSFYSADPWNIIIENMLKESVGFGYSRRALLELNQILNLPGKQRSSVLSTAFAGIGAFKNSSIRQRTSMNDFTYKDLRGMKDAETGEYSPITLYVSSDDSYGMSSVFFNVNTGYLMSFPPNVAGHGPYPMLFVLDNFHFMEKMPKFIDLVGMGRSQKVSFLVVVQDLSQIAAKYSETDLDVLMTNCSIKIIKRTNNPNSSGRFSPLIASRTRRIATGYSFTQTFWGRKDKHLTNLKYKWDSTSIPGMGKSTLSASLGKGDVRILVQGFKNRPIKANALFCRKTDFLAEKMKLTKAEYVSKEIREERDIEDANPPLYVLFETSSDKRKRMQVRFK